MIDVIRQSQLIDKDCVHIVLDKALHYVDMMDQKSLIRLKVFMKKFQFSHPNEFNSLKAKIEEKLDEINKAEVKENSEHDDETEGAKEGEEAAKPATKPQKKLE